MHPTAVGLNNLPPYTLKKHARARHVKLKISRLHGLQITVPVQFNENNLSAILEKNKAWITQQFANIQNVQPITDREDLPGAILLAAMQETWQITYKKSISKKVQLMSHTHHLVLYGAICNKNLCYKVLTKWIKNKAEHYLTSRLKQIGYQLQLNYHGVMIRGQQTRWGSCSSKKIINLNYKMIFLPEHLITHIIIHELCHTVHMNHAKEFWNLVAHFDPRWQENRSELRAAKNHVPLWIK